MLIPDVNVLLYAHMTGFDQHAGVRAWWEDVLSGDEAVGLAPVCALGFVRIATDRRIFTDPMPVSIATDTVASWTAQPHVRVLRTGERHLEIALRLLAEAGTAGNLTTDAQIAAFAVEHDAVVATTDSDFARFDGVRTHDPVTR